MKISLVLGSGGARGLAHIGIIEELEKRGYEIVSISGCSMGALIGGIYAAGKLDVFNDWIRSIDRFDVLKLLDISWTKSGLVKGDKVIELLKGLIGDRDIATLPIKYTAVAADIYDEKEVWLSSGSLFDAIRASISLPMFFTPVPYNNTLLVDGGVLNPVPIAPTFDDGTDFTLAVNLGGRVRDHSRMQKQDLDQTHDQGQSSFDDFLNQVGMKDKFQGFIEQMGFSGGGSPSIDSLGAYDVANQSFDAMQSAIARQKLAAYPPDYVIEIARDACGTLDFHLAEDLIELGRAKARDLLDQISQ